MDYSIFLSFVTKDKEEGFVMKRTFSFKTATFLILFMEETIRDV